MLLTKDFYRRMGAKDWSE